MENVRQRSAAKEAVTIRLDVDAKSQLSQLARAENRTVSSLIDLAVREFLDRRFGGGVGLDPDATLRVRHAALPDTCVLHAFCLLAPAEYEEARRELNLPRFEFVDDRPEWSRLPRDLFAGESDLVESVNWQPIFWHIKRGGSAPRLDWIGPYLQLFVGHSVFIRRDLVGSHLSASDLDEFENFRSEARTGKDLSLRSLTAWIRHSGDKATTRARAIEEAWSDTIVGCQQGTDYHIAVRRVAPVIAELAGSDDMAVHDPTIQGIVSLEGGFRDFCNGTVSGFTGNLLHTAELLTGRRDTALLIAGPADLRVPSLNTLAGHKGMFQPLVTGLQDGGIGERVLELWGRAVQWFRDDVVNGESEMVVQEFVSVMFPDFDPKGRSEGQSPQSLAPLMVLKSLMQTWVRWFANPEEARAFFGENAVGGPSGSASAEGLVQHYQKLCELLNPSAQMTAPQNDDPEERAFWQFPVLLERSGRALTPTSGVPSQGSASADVGKRTPGPSRQKSAGKSA